MAQDTALLRYLLKWARRAPGSWSQRDLAFAFDWTNDYISSNATIGRTGYDMNVSGNVSTGSDGDGSYIQINWNRSHAALTGSRAEISIGTWPTLSQATSFTMKVRFKIIATQPDNASGIFWYNYGAGIRTENNVLATWLKCRIREWASFQDVAMWTYALNTMYDTYLVYDASDQKMYCYFNSTLVNVWWTSVSFSFTDNGNLLLWDNAIWWGNSSSSNKYIYHAAIRNRALSQAEVDADIALWNTAKSDPTIVAYYIPENLQYNTQYMTNPKALDQSPWSLSGASTVTADTTVAPDGTTTADTVAISWTATQWIEQPNTTVTWSTIASKTFIVKAFVKVTAGTALFRLKMSHKAVADYFSSNQTATTDWQEFTFTQAFTASTSGTGIIGWVSNGTGATNPTLLVRNVRVYLVNETLRDESPNIWWYIWWKTQKVLSCRYKPAADFADSPTAWALMVIPRAYMHDRSTDHRPQIRYDDRVSARTSIATPLWVWFRGKVHVLWMIYRTWSAFATKFYTNGVLVDSDTWVAIPASSFIQSVLELWRRSTTYFSWNIRDARIYTFTWSFTNADALAIYNGGEPSSAWVTKYLHYKPPVGEVWTTTQDQSTNDRDWTLNGGVTRNYI